MGPKHLNFCVCKLFNTTNRLVGCWTINQLFRPTECSCLFSVKYNAVHESCVHICVLND